MSEPRLELVMQSIEATLGTIIRVASGYNYDLPAVDVLDLKKDLLADGSGPFRAQVYTTGFENRQQGDEVAHSQTQKTATIHVDGCVAIQDNPRTEVQRAMADIERALMKDISQGGLCINTFVLSGEPFAIYNNFGQFTVSAQVIIRHAANDPAEEYQVDYN